MTFARPVSVLKPIGENSTFSLRDPSKIVRCHNKEDLERLLEWYSYPFIKLRVPDNTFARRRYVEQVRPALRWFCKKFQQDIPEWLQGNGHYDFMSSEEMTDFFGEGPLQVFEFDEHKPVGDTGAST